MQEIISEGQMMTGSRALKIFFVALIVLVVVYRFFLSFSPFWLDFLIAALTVIVIVVGLSINQEKK